MKVSEIVQKTMSAYSYSRYSPSGWRGCITLLRNCFMNSEEIIAFLFSKHMRWAADGDEKRRYGRHNSATLRAYIDKYPTVVEQQELDYLTGKKSIYKR